MENYHQVLLKQREFFQAGHTLSINARIKALKQLYRGIQQAEDRITKALKLDLNKTELEAYSTEIGLVLKEISFTLKNIRSWSKPKRKRTPISHFGASSYVYSQPYGVALIIAPWNYPFQLALAPLVGAIAAGNCAVIKPSELAPHTSGVIAALIKEIYPAPFVTVVEGGLECSQALLDEPFDYIFFTGSVHVGKIVMTAAAKHLVPVTLELGGKSPCIVHKDANIKLAAKRIAWGKFINAGQTCIAPDYLLVHQDVKQAFISHFIEETKQLYGDHILEQDQFTSIISDRHFARLQAFLQNGSIVMGGAYDQANRMIEPTLLDQISLDDSIMREEIFGPILPMITYSEIDEVKSIIEQHRNPLAFYLFTESRELQEKLLTEISFGGGCINDTIYHMPHPYLSFGGIGTSGIGAYHGKSSFDTFTHYKSVLKQTNVFDLPVRYPNMKHALSLIKQILK